MNIFKKFQIGLNKTSTIFSSSLLSVLTKNKIDQEVIDEIENILLSSDIGFEVTNHLIEKIKSSKLSGKEDTNLVLKILCDEIEQILKSKEKILVSESDNKPGALIFIGVNGSGKTTTIGKVINFISDKKILISSEERRKRPKKSEVNRLFCSNKKALKLLNWKPLYKNDKGMILGIKNTINWFSKKENLKKYKSNNFVL